MRSKFVLLVGLATLWSCQPYLDHPLDNGFSAELHARGARRKLHLETVEPSSDSLLLVFNQPIRRLQDQSEPPFLPTVRPALPIQESTYEGAAGIRLKFQNPIPPGRTFTVDVPAGWQSATGTILTQSLHQVWRSRQIETPAGSKPQPELKEPLQVVRLEWVGSQTAHLRFSSAVSKVELQRCLSTLPQDRGPLLEPQGDAISWRLTFERGNPRTVTLAEGLKDLTGRRLRKSVTLDDIPREVVEPASLPQGQLVLPQEYVGPKETLLVLGSEQKGDCDRGVLSLHDQQGRTVWSSRLRWTAQQGFVARLQAPSMVGVYDVRLRTAQGGDWSSRLRVCPLAEDGESYRVELVQEGSQPPTRADLVQAGPNHRKTRLQAYLVPPMEESDYPSEWTRVSPSGANWTPLAETSEDQLTWELPRGLKTSARLLVDAFDKDDPTLLLARNEYQLPGGQPWLTLRREQTMLLAKLPPDLPTPTSVDARLEYQAPNEKSWQEVARHQDFTVKPWAVPLYSQGLYRLSITARTSGQSVLEEVFEREVSSELVAVPDEFLPRVEREDGRQTELRVSETLRLLGRPAALAGWVPKERGRGRESSGGPDRAPLLTPSRLEPHEVGGWRLDRRGSLSLFAPKQVGAYQVWFSSPGQKFAEFQRVDVQLADVPRWKVSGPSGVRVGDSFRAGAEFFPGPLSGSIGLTASAEGEHLPTGYHSTAAVAKGGAQKVLFDYEVSTEADSPIRLAWKVGDSGNLHLVTDEVQVWSIPWVSRLLAKDRLGPSQVRRFTADGPWRLVVSPPGEGRIPGKVLVTEADGKPQMRTLKALDPPWILEAEKAQSIRLEHRGGGPLYYQWSRREQDTGQIETWASRAYLGTMAVNGDGTPVKDWSLGQGMGLLISLVNPEGSLSGEIRVPLPAGVRPTSLECESTKTTEVPWSYHDGTLRLALKDLPEGEVLWKVALEGEATGEFLWPSAQLVSPQAELWALSGSSRIEVRP